MIYLKFVFIFLITDTPPFKRLGQYDFFLNTFIMQGHIQLIKSHSKGIYNVTKLL